MTIRDVTELVRFENSYDESLPITKCICGTIFGSWDFVISIYEHEPCICPNCGRKLFFDIRIKVFEVT